MKADITYRPLNAHDPLRLEAAFAAIGWSKTRAQFERYLEAQESGSRWIRVADIDGAPVGYVTVVWQSTDPVFRGDGTPEIVDLNVLPPYRRQGIGTALVARAEAAVAEVSDRVGLRVGLHPGYGGAQRLYARRGYIPDGRGAVYGDAVVPEGATARFDDDLTLRLSRSLTGPPAKSYLRDLRARVGSRLLMVPSVAVVAHDARGRLLMVRDRVTGDWGLPAGAVELGESPIDAARRELREETGFDGFDWRLLGAVGGADFRHAYPNGDRVEYQITVFSASPRSVPGDGERTGIPPSPVDAVPALDADEIDRVRFFRRRDAPPLRLPYSEGMIWSAPG